MAYIDKNKFILNELKQKLEVEKGPIIGKSETGTLVTAMGKFYSDLLQKDVHVALKQYENSEELEYALMRDLSLLESISNFTNLHEELPLFYGMIKTNDSKPLGIITEDFSKGGTENVEDLVCSIEGIKYFSSIPYELNQLGLNLSEYELAKTAFLVGGQRRIGDLDSLLMNIPESERVNHFLPKIIKEREAYQFSF